MSELTNFYKDPMMEKYKIEHQNPHYDKSCIRHPFRLSIIGASGTGKSNACVNLIKMMPKTFGCIYLLCKVDEAIYKVLADYIDDPEKFKVFKNIYELPNFDTDLPPNTQVLLIIDDYVCDNKKTQEAFEQLFIRCRKLNKGLGMSVMYLSQDYFKLSIVIREQMNYLMLFNIIREDRVKSILRPYCKNKVQFEEVLRFYYSIVEKPLNFMKIDFDPNISINRRFSRNFNDFLVLDASKPVDEPKAEEPPKAVEAEEKGGEIMKPAVMPTVGIPVKPTRRGMRRPKTDATFIMPTGEPVQEGNGIMSKIGNTLTYGIAGNALRHKDELIYGKYNFTDDTQRCYDANKNAYIQHVNVFRRGLPLPVMTALTLIHGDATTGRNYDDDKLYHTGVMLTLNTGHKIILEKRDSIDIHDCSTLPQGSRSLDVNVPQPILLSNAIDSMRKLLGDVKFFTYSATGGRNCQDFVMAFMKSNGLLNPAVEQFVKQDVSHLQKNRTLSSAVNSVTDTSRVLNRLIGGNLAKRTVVISGKVVNF